MDLLDKVQLSYDVSDEDVKDITDGECPMNSHGLNTHYERTNFSCRIYKLIKLRCNKIKKIE